MWNIDVKGAETMNWLNRLNRKFGRYAIRNLMYILSGAILAVYMADWLIPNLNLQSYLYLDMDLVARGEVWRLITFIFMPPASSPLWILFNLYFYCLIGNALENQWGSFKFNLFYLCGMLGAILSALFTGYATNSFLNLSLFFAFAAIYPDFQLLVFFFIPVKIKYLAIIDAIYYVVMLVMGTWSTRIAILMSLINVILFFGGEFLKHLKSESGYWKTRRNFRKYMR